MCFGAAAIRVPMVTLGLLQYLAPILQFVLGVLVFHEEMTTGAVGRLRPGLAGAGDLHVEAVAAPPPPAAAGRRGVRDLVTVAGQAGESQDQPGRLRRTPKARTTTSPPQITGAGTEVRLGGRRPRARAQAAPSA